MKRYVQYDSNMMTQEICYIESKLQKDLFERRLSELNTIFKSLIDKDSISKICDFENTFFEVFHVYKITTSLLMRDFSVFEMECRPIKHDPD